MFNLIQSATKKVNFRDAIDVATIINNSHHIHCNGEGSLQYKQTAQPVRSTYAHLQWKTLPTRRRSTDNNNTTSSKQAQANNICH